MLRSDTIGNTVKENAVIGNDVGVLLFQPVGTTVKENFVSENRTAGIRVRFTATQNLIKENQVVSPCRYRVPRVAHRVAGHWQQRRRERHLNQHLRSEGSDNWKHAEGECVPEQRRGHVSVRIGPDPSGAFHA